MKEYRRALTIAGSDSGGGAGIQADLKTFSALGCYGMSVITALTAQNTVAVTGIFPIPPAFIAQQIDTVMDDIGVDTVKIGMLHSSEVIQVVTDRLNAYRPPNIVLDPVMVAKSGDKLLQDEAITALRTSLMPITTVVTPNLPEASVLLERPIENLAQMQEASRELANWGPQAVLIKGGHLEDETSPDVLYLKAEKKLIMLEADRVDTQNTHGTGCTLSSAIAAYLARGYSLHEAITGAKAYLTAALKSGAAYQLGHGHGPLHHFHSFWE